MASATLTKESVLKVSDRCDRCQAQAYVKASIGDFDLLFCGHHAEAHMSKLLEKGFEIVDERDRLHG